MEVSLAALDVSVGASADRMQGRLLFTDRLQIFLWDDVLVADELGEVRFDLPDAILEVHDHCELVGCFDTIEIQAEEGRRAAARVRLHVLFDRELDVLRGQFAPALVELDARPQLERPRPHLVRRLPLRGQAGTILERFRVAHDQRVVDAVPQRLLALGRSPGERRLGAPLPDGHHQTIAGRRARRASGREQRSAHDGDGGGPGALQERSAVEGSGHGEVLRQADVVRMVTSARRACQRRQPTRRLSILVTPTDSAKPRWRPPLGLGLFAVLSTAATLRLWRLDQNGFGNEYYTAGVRSMSLSWHNFLYNSFDPAGFISVDKPPLALWIQVASVKLFGFHALSVLIPQALEGVAAVALLYHLVQRRFGPAAGLLAALFLALTPVSVAIDRSSNTDSCLVLVLLLAAGALTLAAERGSLALLALAMGL